jgi:hypothetical protein
LTVAITHNNAPALVAGLTKRDKLFIVAAAFLFSIVVVGFAVANAQFAEKNLSISPNELRGVLSVINLPSSTDDSLRSTINVRATDEMIQLKIITNHQAISMLGIAIAIALVAIGFALFVLGTDGAFQLQAAGKGTASASAAGTAPGILCFILAAGLITVAIMHHESLSVGDFSPGGYVIAPAAGSTSASLPAQSTAGNSDLAKLYGN